MFVENVTNLLWFHKFFLATYPFKTMVTFMAEVIQMRKDNYIMYVSLKLSAPINYN